MTTRRRYAAPVLAAAAAALAFALLAWLTAAAPPAVAADAAPTVGCAGTSFTDPAGDQTFDIGGLPLPLPEPDSVDVTAGWFNWDGSKLTANIKVTNLDKSVPAPSNQVIWYMFWTASDDVTYWVDAESDGSAVTYNYGDIENIITTQGTTKGEFHEGKDGVISIVVPQAATKAAEGATLKTPYARTVPAVNLVAVGLLPTADYGPDSQAGKPYKVGACVDGGGGGEAGGGGGGGGASALPVTVTSGGGKASSASKKKSATFTLKASEAVTAIKAKLLKGKKVLGTGSLASANGTAKLKIKLKSKVKKGSYTLSLTGKKADGSTASTTATVKFS